MLEGLGKTGPFYVITLTSKYITRNIYDSVKIFLKFIKIY